LQLISAIRRVPRGVCGDNLYRRGFDAAYNRCQRINIEFSTSLNETATAIIRALGDCSPRGWPDLQAVCRVHDRCAIKNYVEQLCALLAQVWPARRSVRSTTKGDRHRRAHLVRSCRRLRVCRYIFLPRARAHLCYMSHWFSDSNQCGRVAEWFKAPVLKTGRGLRSLVGSNPTPSAPSLFTGVYDRSIRGCSISTIRTTFGYGRSQQSTVVPARGGGTRGSTSGWRRPSDSARRSSGM
jgi:hypothetical protein